MTAQDFDAAFREFFETAWGARSTRARRRLWLETRDDARGRWARVLALRAKNHAYVDPVLEGLLPYADTAHNRARGRWLHPSSTLSIDVREWFEREGWTRSHDWPDAVYATVQFVERCMLCPERAQEVCERYTHHPEARGFHSSLLSPILNALVPDRYHVVNAASLATLRAFTGVPWSPRIETYPKVNAALAAFIDEHRDALSAACAEGHRPCDALDLFARWYVARAPEVLEEPWERAQPEADEPPDVACWKVSPGAHAQRWFKCLADQSIAFAWPELGDLAALSPEGFAARVKALAGEHEPYRGTGVEHLRDLALSPEGAVLVAARGTALVIGVGRVAGPYRYVSGEAYPHRLEVDWFDPGERPVSQPTWSRALAPLDPRWVEEALDVSFSGVHPRAPDDVDERTTAVTRDALAPVAYTRPSTFTAPTLRMEPEEAAPAPARRSSLGAVETGFDEGELERWAGATRRKGQAIVCGPAGAGKSFLAGLLARRLASGDGVVERVQLHAGWRYEDLVEGAAGAPGRLVAFLARHRARRGASALVLDDVHRVDLARVMGEALHALERRDEPVRLASGAELTVPRDVYVIGTMGDDPAATVTDPSVRRRFAIVTLRGRHDVLARFLAARGFDAAGLVAVLRAIDRALGPGAPLPAAHFFCDDLTSALEDIWIHEVEPHLELHLAQRPEALDAFRWGQVRASVAPSPRPPPADAGGGAWKEPA